MYSVLYLFSLSQIYARFEAILPQPKFHATVESARRAMSSALSKTFMTLGF